MLGLAIFDITREPGTNTTQKNWVWVWHYQVWVIIPIITWFIKKKKYLVIQ
jgi:hypothetical protein